MKLNPQIKMRGSRMRHPRPRRPAAPKSRRPATILVPTDFSYAADRALRLAVQLARAQRARVALLHVIAPAVIPDVFRTPLRTDLPQMVERSAGHLARLARRMRVRPAHEAVKTGHAAEEILAFAEEIGASLIVLGARGHSQLDRLLMGTTAERVVRYARCPVLVVPLPRIGVSARSAEALNRD